MYRMRRCDGVGDDATGDGDDDGAVAAGVEAEGGIRDGVGDGDGAASREVAAALRLDSLTAQNQISP
jgi:hypothetical protein